MELMSLTAYIRPGAVERETLPEQAAKRLPRYPSPVSLIAQLAVDKNMHGSGLGKITLVKALEYLWMVNMHMPARERRSVSQEVVLIIERYLSHPEHFLSNPTDQFLQMAGSWIDERSAEDILSDIGQNRTDSVRFERDNELFD